MEGRSGTNGSDAGGGAPKARVLAEKSVMDEESIKEIVQRLDKELNKEF
jgi:hypothetical protein